MFNTVFSPGDFTGDGKADLIARTPPALFLYRGNGAGGFTGGGVRIGAGWNMFNTVFSPCDFTGDGSPDVGRVSVRGALPRPGATVPAGSTGLAACGSAPAGTCSIRPRPAPPATGSLNPSATVAARRPSPEGCGRRTGGAADRAPGIATGRLAAAAQLEWHVRGMR